MACPHHPPVTHGQSWMAAGARAASSLRCLTTAARDGLTAGSVHIRVFPRPRNLAESSEILRALEKYGEITMYKHLKYEPLAPAPNTILAIYQNPESAQKLISVSPLQLRLERRDSSWKYLGSEDLTEVDKPTTDDQAPVIQEEEATASAEIAKSESKPSASNNASQTSTPIATKSNPSQLPNGTQKWGSRGPSVEKPLPPPPPHSPIPSDSTPKPPPSPSFPLFPLEPQKTDRYGRSISTRYREYKLEIRPSNMNHKAYIARQAYFGPFPPDRKTIMAAGLEGRVPLDGIVDCHVGKPEVPLRVRVKMKERGAFKRFSIRELFEKGVKEGRGD